MEEPLIRLFIALVLLAIYLLIWFLLIRAAVISALRKAGPDLRHTNQLLAAQADLTARLVTHVVGTQADARAPAEPSFPPGFNLPFS